MEAIYTPPFKLASAIFNYRFNAGALTTDSKSGLTLSVGAGTPVEVNGRYGKAVSLDTSTYYTRATSLTVGGSWSFNCWIKDWVGAIISSKSGSGENYLQISGSNLNFTGRNTDGSGVSESVGLPAGYDSSEFNMISVTVNQVAGDYTIKLYCNGVEIHSHFIAGKLPGVWESPFSFCHYYIEGKNGATGVLDDPMWWTAALTAVQIKQLYIDVGFPVAALM